MRKAYREVTFRKQERIEADDELADIPEKLTEEYEMLKDAPVTLKLGETGRVGVTGPQDALVHILKLMTLDLASRHYYTDIQLVYSISERTLADLHGCGCCLMCRMMSSDAEILSAMMRAGISFLNICTRRSLQEGRTTESLILSYLCTGTTVYADTRCRR